MRDDTRRRRRRPPIGIATLLVALAAGAPARAAGPSPAASPPRAARAADVDRWAGELASDDWAARQRAQEQLTAAGEDALPRLRQIARDATDDEVRVRARVAVGQIEQNRLLGQSLVTIRLTDVPAADAFAELTRQAGGALAAEPSNLLTQKTSKRVSLNVDREPFWSVMQSLCAQTEFEVGTVSRNNRDLGLGLSAGGTGWMDKPITLAGPLLIRADRVRRVSAIRLRGAQASGEFSIYLSVFAEPKLRVLDYSGTLHLEKVVDDRGNSLIPTPDDVNVDDPDVFGNGGQGATSHWEVGASLRYPKGAGRKISLLKARTVLLVQTASETFEAPLGTKRATRTVSGIRVSVKSLDGSRAEVSVHRDGRSDVEWYGVRMQLSAGEARLLDDKGQVVARGQSGLDIEDSADNARMDFRIRFARDGADDGRDGRRKGASEAPAVTFQWQFPTDTRELSVPFEFRDLPIP